MASAFDGPLSKAVSSLPRPLVMSDAPKHCMAEQRNGHTRWVERIATWTNNKHISQTVKGAPSLNG